MRIPATSLLPIAAIVRRSMKCGKAMRSLPGALQGLLILMALFASASTALRAEEPEVQAAVSSDRIFVGETIDYQVEIRNSEHPVAPDISTLKEHFDVVANGDQSRNQSSTFIVNGRVSQQSVLSHLYLYRLTPKASGDLTIPPVRVKVDGKEFTSNPVIIHVQDAEEQDLVIVETKVSHSTVYPTQPFSVTLRVLVQPLSGSSDEPLRPLQRRPPQLQINWVDIPKSLTAETTSQWLQPFVSDDGVGFTVNEISTSTGFLFGGSRLAVFALGKGRETRNGLDGKPIEYFVYELTRSFVPERTEQYTFGPALVKGTFVGGIQNGEFYGRSLVAIATAVTLEVREVPSPRPATFTGGIGEYLVAASASPVKLRVGDPLTLTLQFTRGQQGGSLDLVSAPDLASISAIAEGFDIIDRAPTGRVENGVKKFGYALRPRRPGVSIPAIALTTFNPISESFTEVTTDPVALEVAEAVALSTNDLVGTGATKSGGQNRQSSAGIFQNITDPSELRNQRVNPEAWAFTVAGFWGLVGCVVLGVGVQRRKSADPIRIRRSAARKSSLAKLSGASRMIAEGQTKEALRQIRAAFVSLIADINNCPAEGLTAADVTNAFPPAAVSAEDQQAVRRLLESIEGAEYGAGDSINAADAVRTATDLIERLGPSLERSSRR